MIKFFRKIRHKLFSENKFSKYLLYAIGEIVLVVIGILIALQLNIQNEKRKLNLRFESTIEELYNSIKLDVERLNKIIQFKDFQINTLQIIINYPDSLNRDDLMSTLYMLTYNSSEFNSETQFFLGKLDPDPLNKIQNDLVRDVNNYVNQLNRKEELLDNTAYLMLRKKGIPTPLPVTLNKSLERIAPDYYSEYDYIKLENLLNDDLVKTELKTLIVNLTGERSGYFLKYGTGLSLVNKIKKYYPSVRPLFQDVGIIGTSIDGFDNVGARSTPMIQTNIENSIWEIKLYLKEGRVKFRCRDSWSQNWGGDSFPEGYSHFDGNDIEVTEEGNYHIILNLSENYYNFIRLE